MAVGKHPRQIYTQVQNSVLGKTMPTVKDKGFTLVEIMMIMAVLSILVALAAPGLRTLMDKNAVIAQSNELMSNILLARSEAIKREESVVLRRVGGWKDRYRVFVDLNGNNNYNNATEKPIIVDNITPENTVAITGNGHFSTFLRFNSRGRAVIPPSFTTLTPGSDYFKLTRNNQTRYVCFSATGRPRVQEAACQ
jgi:type IV fimbrial biogenesis protein FimT